VNNNHHKDHGAAILAQFNQVTYNAPATTVAINNCNFSYNGGAKSLVYITSGAKLELINTSSMITKVYPFMYKNLTFISMDKLVLRII